MTAPEDPSIRRDILLRRLRAINAMEERLGVPPLVVAAEAADAMLPQSQLRSLVTDEGEYLARMRRVLKGLL